MRCESAQAALSQAMDDRASSSLPEVRAHVDGCPVCSAFEAGAWRIRELARFEVAPAVPDLVPAIMTRVEEDQARGRRRRRQRPGNRPRARWGALRPALAAAVVGLVAGAMLTGGDLITGPGPDTSALAAEIPHQLQAAARALRGYSATFDITELHWSRRVPMRTFVATLSFDAPEAFRVDVRDTTRYPSAAWPRNDLQLVTDGRSWRATGPNPCPRQALPNCFGDQPVTWTVTGQPPFDASTVRLTDIVVPMTVLAAADRVRVVGEGMVAGREAVAVQLDYENATPLFQYLTFLGSWRPFYPQDRVVVWLDSRTWFPLRYEVFPAAGQERALWASQAGFPREGPSTPVFIATVRSLDDAAKPSPSLFRVRRGTQPVQEGFRDGARTQVQPAWIGNLSFTRSGTYARTPARPYDEAVAAYARGLAWVTVTEVTGWTEGRPFGIGPFAEPVRLSNGTGMYEPATATDPRRVALHTSRAEFLVASNLPRGDLLRVAGSLPVEGLAQPRSWRVRRWEGGVTVQGLAPAEALARVPFDPVMPATLPAGYAPSGAEITRTAAGTTLTVAFRHAAAELDGVGLLFSQAPGQGLPPPQEAMVEAVQLLPGVSARWSPQRHLLEWVDGGSYRSLSGPGFGLSTLAQAARSLRPVTVP